MLRALVDRERSIASLPWTSDPWGYWPGDGGTGPTWSGQPVTEHSATQLLAVYGSVTFIVDEIATLPVDVIDAPRPIWVDNPTEDLDRLAWVGQIVWSLLLAGNAYLAVMELGGRIVALDVLDPCKVNVSLVKGRKVATVNGVRPPFRILHIPGRVRPGDLVGLSPLEYARQTIGLGLGGLKYGAEFFDGDGNMPGVIEAPGSMQPETQRQTAQSWRAKRQKGGRGLPGILQNGATWKPTGVTNEQAQFLATRKWTAAEIAGQMFLLDPSDLGIPVEGSTLTYANMEQRNSRRLQVTLMPWIRRIESAISGLIPGGMYRFDVDSRLRGHTRESYETLKVAVDGGFMTIDEAREIIGSPPIKHEISPSMAGLLADMARKMFQSVGVILTPDEARGLMNAAGAKLSPEFTPPTMPPIPPAGPPTDASTGGAQ